MFLHIDIVPAVKKIIVCKETHRVIEHRGSARRDLKVAREDGQGMVEYGLIIALVAVVAIAGLIILGPQLQSLFSSLGSSV
jgi:pilus assembly protein Flp/PilA